MPLFRALQQPLNMTTKAIPYGVPNVWMAEVGSSHRYWCHTCRDVMEPSVGDFTNSNAATPEMDLKLLLRLALLLRANRVWVAIRCALASVGRMIACAPRAAIYVRTCNCMIQQQYASHVRSPYFVYCVRQWCHAEMPLASWCPLNLWVMHVMHTLESSTRT